MSSFNLIPRLSATAFVLIFFGVATLSGQDLYLNEIMSTNSETITDEDGDTEDWIEIYYIGEQPLNMEGYGLSDDYERPFRWVFPDTTIQSGDYLLIWASNKDRRIPGNELHTNFAISSDGEEVILTHPDSTRIDEFPPTAIPTDVSAGRQPDGTGDWEFFTQPTPGASNSTEAYSDHLVPPLFSLEAGYLFDHSELELTHPEVDAEIRYTIDGSKPTSESAIYTGGIELTFSDNNSLMYIETSPPEASQRGFGWRFPSGQIPGALVIRARAFKDGFISSDVVSKTYLNSDYQHDLSVISISTNRVNLFSDSIGIYVPGDIYNELGWAENDHWGRPNANYHQRGVEWERPASIELIEMDGGYHSQDIGLRMHGGGSRAQPQKSFRLYARNSYGDSRFNYDMFQNGETGFNRLVLRNSGQDFFTRPTMFVDALSQTLVSHYSFETQAYRPFAVYINGEYWGIKNLRERFDRHYLERKYGVSEQEIDLLTNVGEVVEGSSDYYNAVLDSLEQNHIENLGGLEFIERHFDLQNFAEFYAAQIYFVNIDWPGNNNDYWRYTGSPEPRGSIRDGRFRWMMYDLDFGFAHFSTTDYDNNLFDHLMTTENITWSNPTRATLLFRSFIQNRDFLEYYVNTQLDMLNTSLNEDRVAGVVRAFRTVYENEMPQHIQRWRYPDSIFQWNDHIDLRIRFAENRPSRLRQQMVNRFPLGQTATVNIHNSEPHKGKVRINNMIIAPETPGIEPNPYPWSGFYFTEVPITLTGLPETGYKIKEWEVNEEIYRQQQIIVSPQNNMTVRVYFEEIEDPEDETNQLLYYWYFDTEIPNNTPLETIPESYSSTGNQALLSYQAAISPYPPGNEDVTAGIMDRVSDPTQINYRPQGNLNREYDEDEMRGIRVRNPSRLVRDGNLYESALVFGFSTVEYEDVIFSFVANRTNSGQEQMDIWYSVNEGEPEWRQDRLPVTFINTTSDYSLYTIDFSGIEEHRHNPDFRVKITFSGANTSGDSGNTRFNNIAVFGSPYTGPRIEDITESRMQSNYPNPFNTGTTVNYQIEHESEVILDLFDINGRRVARLEHENKPRGYYTIHFDGAGLASGVYILRLMAGDDIDVQKLTLIK